jgi:hypothetical protein
MGEAGSVGGGQFIGALAGQELGTVWTDWMHGESRQSQATSTAHTAAPSSRRSTRLNA